MKYAHTEGHVLNNRFSPIGLIYTTNYRLMLLLLLFGTTTVGATRRRSVQIYCHFSQIFITHQQVL